MKYKIIRLATSKYKVEKSDGTTYLVNLIKGTCTCLGFNIYKKCKHIPLVQGYRIAEEQREITTLKENVMTKLAFQKVEEKPAFIICIDKVYCSMNNGCILDIETTGLEFNKDEIITFGFIKDNELRVVQRKELSTKSFYDYISRTLHSLPQPIFAYNKKFEESFLKFLFNFQGELVDLMEPWRIKAEDIEVKYPTLDELLPSPEAYIGERRTTGAEVIPLWQTYLKDGNEKNLASIIRHNQIDLLQSMSVFLMSSLIQ